MTFRAGSEKDRALSDTWLAQRALMDRDETDQPNDGSLSRKTAKGSNQAPSTPNACVQRPADHVTINDCPCGSVIAYVPVRCNALLGVKYLGKHDVT